MSSIQLYAQHGKQNPDTVRCYGLTELRYIASTLVEAKACDTLLSIADVKLANRDSVIAEKAYQITQLQKQLSLKDQIIELKDQEIMKLSTALEKSERRRKWLKLGWVSTTVLLGGTLIYLSL